MDIPVEKELTIASIIGDKIEIIAPVNSPSLDFNDNEDIPTELSDSSETHDEGASRDTRVELCALWAFVLTLHAMIK